MSVSLKTSRMSRPWTKTPREGRCDSRGNAPTTTSIRKAASPFNPLVVPRSDLTLAAPFRDATRPRSKRQPHHQSCTRRLFAIRALQARLGLPIAQHHVAPEPLSSAPRTISHHLPDVPGKDAADQPMRSPRSTSRRRAGSSTLHLVPGANLGPLVHSPRIGLRGRIPYALLFPSQSGGMARSALDAPAHQRHPGNLASATFPFLAGGGFASPAIPPIRMCPSLSV